MRLVLNSLKLQVEMEQTLVKCSTRWLTTILRMEILQILLITKSFPCQKTQMRNHPVVVVEESRAKVMKAPCQRHLESCEGLVRL